MSWLPAVATALSLVTLVRASNLTAQVTDDISSCGSTWMAIDDVTIGNGTDHRTGFATAVSKFCAQASGITVKSQGYLSMATELFLNGGKDTSVYGLLGYYLSTLSATGGDCYGTEHHDTKGGTYQVGNNQVSYHALANTVPPQQDAINKLLYDDVLAAQKPNTGAGPPLNPWPLDSLDGVLPVACHSHNDYDHDIPLFQALSAGCVGIEADVWLVNGDVSIGHILPTIGRTLALQYVNPLKAIVDHNGGSVYKAKPAQSVVLLVDFKTSDAGTLDAVVKSIDPLRQAGYLSRLENGVFVRGAVTVVASGSAPFGRISAGDGVPDRDVFYDAHVDDLGAEDYSSQNSVYASADFQDAVGNPSSASLSQDEVDTINSQVEGAHQRGLIVRYCESSATRF
ncbi:hypothetical protein Hte_001787 [Hypoxylon texense]